MKTLKVSNNSKAYSVATSIAENIKKDGSVQVLSIGATSTYETTKALIHAKGLLASSGLKMVCFPSFVDVEIDVEKNSEEIVLPESNICDTNVENSQSNKKVRTAVKWIVKAIPEEY